MKPGVTNTDLNSPEKLELEVARILAKRKKRLGGMWERKGCENKQKQMW